jgi:hypothetical protein
VITKEGGSKITLKKGEVYSSYESTNATGAHLTSTKPVAYFVTNAGTQIPNGIASVDYLYQQMSPVSTWGKTFFVPVTHREKELVRVLASENNTKIKQNGDASKNASLTLNKGQFVELEISLTGGGCYITSDKPVAVCTYMYGLAYSGLAVYKGDPSITWVPPVEQFVTHTLIAPFATNENTSIDDHYALIITPDTSKNKTTMAIGSNTPGSLAGGTWTKGKGTGAGYSFYTLKLTNTNKSYFFSNPDGMMVLGYGIGAAESYYYLAASAAYDLNNGFFVNGFYHDEVKGKIFCDGTIQLQTVTDYSGVTMPSNYLRWFIDDIEDNTAANKWNWSKTLAPGYHTVKLVVNGDTNNAVTTNFTIDATVSISNVAVEQPCGSVDTGTITVTAEGGSGNGYQYSKDDGQTWQDSNVLTGLAKGICHIAVRSTCFIARQDVEINTCRMAIPVNPNLRIMVQ